MTKQQRSKLPLRFANVFGILGYTSVLMQWLWLFATLLIPIAENPAVREWLVPSASHPSEQLPTASPELPAAVQYILIVLSVLFIVAVVVYLIKAVPKAIGQTGKTITQGSAKVVVPHIAKQRKLPAKQEKKLFEEVTWVIKLTICLLPVLALAIPIESPFGIEYLHVVVFGLFCGIWSLFWFGLQLALVRLTKLDLKKVW